MDVRQSGLINPITTQSFAPRASQRRQKRDLQHIHSSSEKWRNEMVTHTLHWSSILPPPWVRYSASVAGWLSSHYGTPRQWTTSSVPIAPAGFCLDLLVNLSSQSNPGLLIKQSKKASSNRAEEPCWLQLKYNTLTGQTFTKSIWRNDKTRWYKLKYCLVNVLQSLFLLSVSSSFLIRGPHSLLSFLCVSPCVFSKAACKTHANFQLELSHFPLFILLDPLLEPVTHFLFWLRFREIEKQWLVVHTTHSQTDMERLGPPLKRKKQKALQSKRLYISYFLVLICFLW